MPIILGSVIHMIAAKMQFYQKIALPLDFYKTIGGKRIFGDNKTFAGVLVLPISCMAMQILWGVLCKQLHISDWNQLYVAYPNSISFNAVVGFMFGIIYILFELPNSFIKRRLEIPPGKTVKGWRGIFFFLYDQVDSLIGVMLILVVVSHISMLQYLRYVILGGVTHITINIILYRLKIRRNL